MANNTFLELTHAHGQKFVVNMDHVIHFAGVVHQGKPYSALTFTTTAGLQSNDKTQYFLEPYAQIRQFVLTGEPVTG